MQNIAGGAGDKPATVPYPDAETKATAEEREKGLMKAAGFPTRSSSAADALVNQGVHSSKKGSRWRCAATSRSSSTATGLPFGLHRVDRQALSTLRAACAKFWKPPSDQKFWKPAKWLKLAAEAELCRSATAQRGRES